MKTNIRYSIWALLLDMILFPICLTGLIILMIDKEWVAVFCGVFLCIACISLVDSIRNIQWFDVRNGNITVRCPFGIIKSVPLSQIKRAFKTNAVIFYAKGFGVCRPHIVLCLIKSVKKSDIGDSYNRKKNKYIILPHTAETELMIRTEYQKSCNRILIVE